MTAATLILCDVEARQRGAPFWPRGSAPEVLVFWFWRAACRQPHGRA